jgi:hypothetical protein
MRWVEYEFVESAAISLQLKRTGAAAPNLWLCLSCLGNAECCGATSVSALEAAFTAATTMVWMLLALVPLPLSLLASAVA